MNNAAVVYKKCLSQSKEGPKRTAFADNVLFLRGALADEEWGAPAKLHAFIEHFIAADYGEHEVELLDVPVGANEPLASLRERYDFRGGARVERFLEHNPLLISFLLSAHERIHKYFGSDVRVVLDVIKDSEIGDEERLFVFVQTELPADDALDHLYELYEQWWLEALSKVQPKMSIDVEFV